MKKVKKNSKKRIKSKIKKAQSYNLYFGRDYKGPHF